MAGYLFISKKLKINIVINDIVTNPRVMKFIVEYDIFVPLNPMVVIYII